MLKSDKLFLVFELMDKHDNGVIKACDVKYYSDKQDDMTTWYTWIDYPYYNNKQNKNVYNQTCSLDNTF